VRTAGLQVIPIKERGSKKDGTGDWRKKRSGDAFFLFSLWSGILLLESRF
jgi:hypothetical protein